MTNKPLLQLFTHIFSFYFPQKPQTLLNSSDSASFQKHQPMGKSPLRHHATFARTTRFMDEKQATKV